MYARHHHHPYSCIGDPNKCIWESDFSIFGAKLELTKSFLIAFEDAIRNIKDRIVPVLKTSGASDIVHRLLDRTIEISSMMDTLYVD